jgi:hypothetical protein
MVKNVQWLPPALFNLIAFPFWIARFELNVIALACLNGISNWVWVVGSFEKTPSVSFQVPLLAHFVRKRKSASMRLTTLILLNLVGRL